MSMRFKVQLLDETAMRRALTRISFEIVEKCYDPSALVIVGIKTRGVPLAKIIAANIEKNSGICPPCGELDITAYRDDLYATGESPKVSAIDLGIGIDITGREVVLVDDVLFTGRTVRAAIDALFSIGRPSRIRLAALIDRGHRELPIRPDYIGKNVPTSLRESISVNLEETDGKMNVELYETEE